MENTRKLILNVLFALLLIKVLIWILKLLNVFGSQIAAHKTFFFALFENLNRGFILIIPFLFLLSEGLKKNARVHLLIAFLYFMIYGFCFSSDTVFHFDESKVDLLIIVSAFLFCVPVFLLYRKTSPKTTYHHVRLAWSVILLLYGFADYMSSGRVELKTMSEYTLLFCSITYMAQFLLGKEKI